MGRIGLEGYWTCRHITEQLELIGYIPADTLAGLNYLLRRQLIAADHLNFRQVNFDDSGKILALGFIHLRFLPADLNIYTAYFRQRHSRRSYCAKDRRVHRTGEFRGHISARDKTYAVEELYRYLFEQHKLLRRKQPFASTKTGASLVLGKLKMHCSTTGAELPGQSRARN